MTGSLDQRIVHEAVRLCGLLLDHPATARPEVHALLALMLFLGARLPARTDAAGELLTLVEQDRAKWDGDWLRCAAVGSSVLWLRELSKVAVRT